jgi:hypothetical protein
MADGRWQMADCQKLTIVEVGKLPEVAFLFSGIATAPDARAGSKLHQPWPKIASSFSRDDN